MAAGKTHLLGTAQQTLVDVLTSARSITSGRIVVPPSYVDAVAPHVADGVVLAALAGYPTGRHHPLVTATEGRLAVQSGAHEVWACVDHTRYSDPEEADNALLGDMVTLREAIPAPARLVLFTPAIELAPKRGWAAVAVVARRAGCDAVAAPAAMLGDISDAPLDVIAVD